MESTARVQGSRGGDTLEAVRVEEARTAREDRVSGFAKKTQP